MNSTNPKGSKFSIKTLGCKVNQYEEQVIREKLLRSGFAETDPGSADILIMNSCTVTAQADAKTRQFLRKAKKNNPNIKIAVTGCYAVLPEDIAKLTAMPEVDIVVPGGDKDRIAEILFGIKNDGCSGKGIEAFGGHTRAFLKIQDGCDQRCSYCKINIVRGRSISRTAEDVLAEAERLAGKSPEIVLTGICLGAWKGEGKGSLADLIERIDDIDGDFRVRLSSIEPNFVDDRLIMAVKSSARVCRHLHVPLQSGSDRILKQMNRKYDLAYFREMVNRIRERMPLCGITTDIITAFPGETEKDIEETSRFVEEIKPSRMHVFTYSDRGGTPASRMEGKVSKEAAKVRTAGLIKIGETLADGFRRQFLEKNVEVLVEETQTRGFYEGYTGEYIRVGFESNDKIFKKGDIVRIKCEKTDELSSGLIGRLC
ncbi:MAG: tRNA (N(6)-L-threonylcarbamoyladenosine(37)-C(2))-methylthiotransferase MtaB [Candidatus Omnitrophota bacterium]